MASNRFSWDEQIFFIFDHMQLQAECDDLNDAIVFFMPRATDVSTQCALCGQLMGMVTFFKHMTGAPPVEFMLNKCKFTLRHFGRFTMAMSESRSYTGRVVDRQLEKLHQLFTFYQHSLKDVFEDSGGDFKMFQNFVRGIFASYVPYVWRYSDLVAASFESLPSVEPTRCGTNVLLEASDLLQRIQRMPDVFAGCVFLQNRVLCSQLDSELTSYLLLIQQQKMEFPCQRIQPAFDLPQGVCLISVYLTEDQMKLLSPFSSRLPHRPNHSRHKTAPGVRPAHGSTTIQRKPHQQTPETLSARPEFVPSMSPGTTSEEECAGSCFQTQADVHNECTCHSVTDVSQLNPLAVGPCTQHDNTSSINLESSSAIVARGVLCKISQEHTTQAMNTDLQKRTPGQLPRYCATDVETIESNASVTESRHPDVVAQDSCETPPPEPYRGEPEFISRSTQYTQSRGMDSSHATVTDDCLRLQEEIGNMPYDISYDMHYDKVDVETQPSYTDDICRTHSSIQHKSDFILTQNDSGVLEDSSSPSVRIIDLSEDSTSDLDDTDGGTGSSLCCAIAETHGDSSGNSCHDTSVAETVQVKTAVVEDCCTAATHEAAITADVTESEHASKTESESDVKVGNQDDVIHEVTHQAVITANAESEHASKTEGENDVEGRNHDDLKHEATITVVVETESENVEAEKENRNMNVESELRSDSENDFEGGNQDDVKHEATHEAAITVDVESEHASKTENEHDVEVRKYDATLEATFTVSVETESEHVEAEKENRNMNVESELGSDSENDFEGETQDDVKHEATHEAAITVDVESEHASKTENENDVEVRKHDATLEDTITVVVETESEHVEAENENRNMNIESELRSDSENDFEGGQQDDVKHKSTTTIDAKSETSKTDSEINVKTESEHIKLKTAHDIAMDDQGKIAKTESKDAVVKVVEAVVLEECESYVKSEIHKEADNVEDICTKCGSEETDGRSSGSRNYGMGDTCYLGDCDRCPSEMPHNDDNLTSTERSEMRHPEVSHGDSKCAVVDQSDRLHQKMLHSNSDTELSHGDSDNTCIGKAEICHPCELHGDIVNTLTETDDMQDLDSLNSSDTVPYSDVVSLPGVQRDRPSEEMVNVDLYVQTNCDLMLLLLMEDGVTSHEETVTDVWRAVTPQLASLDYSIKQSTRGRSQSPEVDESSYNYLTFDTFTEHLSGKIAMPIDLQHPMSALESQFCDTAVLLHEEFHTSETLKELTLRNHNTSVYGSTVLGQETFFQLKNTSSDSQAPSEKDVSMCIDKEASQTLLKNHHIHTT
ncbi:hypothetical protein LSAT2_002950 [Lamellibrachia satsuma]|nr:hypothetical protein LSAT2_002950 [Lamellibrachia satsuma]